MRERAEHRWFQATMMSIGDAVLATDADGRIIFMNGIAEGLTGWMQATPRGGKSARSMPSWAKKTAPRQKRFPAAKSWKTAAFCGEPKTRC